MEHGKKQSLLVVAIFASGDDVVQKMGISSEGIKFFPQFFGTDLLSLNFSNL